MFANVKLLVRHYQSEGLFCVFLSLLFCFFLYFNTGFPCVDLAILELALNQAGYKLKDPSASLALSPKGWD